MSLLGLGCSCKDSKSVSVAASGSASTQSSSSDMKSTTTTVHGGGREVSSAGTLTLTSPSNSSYWEEDVKMDSAPSTPRSFSGLLRQLGEMEQDVMAWGRCTLPAAAGEAEKRQWAPSHRRSSSEGGGRRVEESVAVVKETEDPLGEFRRSMLQMIVEKEIVDGGELRELLRRFLSLNSPRHHSTILRAFAEIWEEVFAGYERTPELLRRRRDPRLPPPPRRP